MVKTWEQLADIQPIVVKMLLNSIRKDRIAHAYLFEGPRGTGKMDMSIQLGKSLFCMNPSEATPCQVCSNCKRIESGNHPDVFIIQPDGLSIKKQQIHFLQEEFSKTGVESKQKLYIVEHADKMTINAANSLLKFLEEPYPGTFAILLTEQSQKLLNTIISRCQNITFRPLSKEKLAEDLINEGIPVHMARLAAELTNDSSEASVLSNDDWFAQARALVIKLYEALKSMSGESLLFIHEKWMKHFNDKEQLQIGLDMLLIFYKDLLYIQIGEEEKVVFQDQLQFLKKASFQHSGKKISSGMLAILETKKRIGANVNTQLLFEQLVLRLQEG